MFSMAIAYWLLYQALCSYRPQHSSCDAKTLEPKRLLTYAEADLELSRFGICAHLPKDRERGRMCNYLIFEQGVMSVFASDLVSEPARLVWNTPLPCPPCYIHSLAMTESYAVFIRNVRRSRISIPIVFRPAVPKWTELTRGFSHQIITQYWRYFGVHSHRLPLIKRQSPRIVKPHIDKFNMVWRLYVVRS